MAMLNAKPWGCFLFSFKEILDHTENWTCSIVPISCVQCNYVAKASFSFPSTPLLHPSTKCRDSTHTLWICNSDHRHQQMAVFHPSVGLSILYYSVDSIVFSCTIVQDTCRVWMKFILAFGPLLSSVHLVGHWRHSLDIISQAFPAIYTYSN